MSDELDELRARLFLDQDVRVQLAGMLRAHLVDVETTLEAGRLGADDDNQLAYAVANERAVLTHNRLDFEALHRTYLELGRPHFGIMIAVQRYDLSVTRD